MNPQELAELEELQSKLEKAKDSYLKFLLSKNYKIRVFYEFENSKVAAIHKDYLDERSWEYCRAKDDSPDWAEIILFELDSLMESYESYESTKPEFDKEDVS